MKNIILICAVSSIVGCASYKTPTYSPDYVAIDALKTYKLKKVAVNPIQPEDPDAKVNKITLRGGSLVVDGGTFATYLQNAIKSDLTEIGVFDPTAQTKLDVVILKNDIDVSGLSVGTGELEISLKITSNNNIVLDKNYSANTQFESAFAAIVAVPKGQSEYPKLVKELLANVFADKQFIEAIQETGELNAKKIRK